MIKVKNFLNNIKRLEEKNSLFLHLTANENQMSRTANSFLSSKLSERYYFGGGKNNVVDLGFLTFLGLKEVEDLITVAEGMLKKMLHASIVNMKCLSGVHTMMSVIMSVSQPGDTIMTIKREDGGHFATDVILERINRRQIYASYIPEKLNFDAEKTAKDFKKHRAKVLYLDILSRINPVNLRELKEALGDKVIIIYDASHTLGLIIGQQFQKPLIEGADIITGNTHKTFPGPQKGIVAFKDRNLGGKVNSVLERGLYSSSHTHHLIALAITVLEMGQYGRQYTKQIIGNSQVLGEALENLGYQVRKAPDGKFSHNHQLHVFIDNKKAKMRLFRNLINNYISTNFIEQPEKKIYMRLGTQEVTRRGMKESDMFKIAVLLDKALKGENVKREILSLNRRFNKINYSFD